MNSLTLNLRRLLHKLGEGQDYRVFKNLGDRALDSPSFILILKTGNDNRYMEKTGMLDVPAHVMKIEELELPAEIVNRQIKARGDEDLKRLSHLVLTIR